MYGRFPTQGQPIPFSFGQGEDPAMAAYGAMQDAGQKQRAMEMMRLSGYRNMSYSGGADGGMGVLGGSPMTGNPYFSGNPIGGMPWYRQSPMIQFPQGGMMQ
jgi:hypothetical protein